MQHSGGHPAWSGSQHSYGASHQYRVLSHDWEEGEVGYTDLRTSKVRQGSILSYTLRCEHISLLYTLAHKLIIVPSPVSSSSVRNTASPRTTRAPPRTVLLPSSYLRPVLGRTCRTRRVLLQPRLWLQSSVRPQARLQAVRDHQPLVASPSLHP